jgi:hypothetical protein
MSVSLFGAREERGIRRPKSSLGVFADRDRAVVEHPPLIVLKPCYYDEFRYGVKTIEYRSHKGQFNARASVRPMLTNARDPRRIGELSRSRAVQPRSLLGILSNALYLQRLRC